MNKLKKYCLVILDGWGHGEDPLKSAINQANTPYIDHLYKNYPNAELVTHGNQVGLPIGQMGNSEVGHLNIGAGRIVYQELARINKAMEDGSLAENSVLLKALNKAKSNNQTIHLMGLVSDGGVHSHINHLKALCNICDSHGLNDVFVHAFLDGRDTAPDGGKEYIADLLDHIKGSSVKLGSIIGRYYAMDRDKRWERTKLAYDLLVNGIADENSDDPIQSLKTKYTEGVTDEFMRPILVNTGQAAEKQKIKDGDLVICFNFRTDRPRQISEVISQQDMHEYNMHMLDIDYLTMTMYDEQYKNVAVLFTKDNLHNTIGQVFQDAGLTQLRIAETEKYPHVTFFFSGGREEVFENERRILINSPKVATYDLQPEMSAYELTEALCQNIKKNPSDFIVVNYANTDMVGHTGIMSAAIIAAETVDVCVSKLVPVLLAKDYGIVIIADHGNADIMIKEDGSPHTAHTTSPVPIIVIDEAVSQVRGGKLADVAVTILHQMGVGRPAEMDGEVITA